MTDWSCRICEQQPTELWLECPTPEEDMMFSLSCLVDLWRANGRKRAIWSKRHYLKVAEQVLGFSDMRGQRGYIRGGLAPLFGDAVFWPLVVQRLIHPFTRSDERDEGWSVNFRIEPMRAAERALQGFDADDVARRELPRVLSHAAYMVGCDCISGMDVLLYFEAMAAQGQNYTSIEELLLETQHGPHAKDMERMSAHANTDLWWLQESDPKDGTRVRATYWGRFILPGARTWRQHLETSSKHPENEFRVLVPPR